MPDERRKTINYHRAEYFIEKPETINLGLCIKQATDALTTVRERTIQRPGGYLMKLARFKPQDDHGGCFLHLTFETPGEHASVVPHTGEDASEVLVTTMPPPNNAEFMDGDAFLYVKKNDVCICTTAVTSATARYFLQEFFDKAKIRKDARQFSLMNAVDVKKFALIHTRGVKEIEIKASMYKASADYVTRKNHVTGVLGSATRFVRAIFGSEYDVSDDALRVALTLKVDKRHDRGSIIFGQKRMEDLAKNIIQNEQDDDEYIIRLEGGDTIKPGELVLRRLTDIDSMGKSVSRDEAWEALAAYYAELVEGGQLG